MTLQNLMGKHTEWRKIAKKERRRKIRIQRARNLDIQSNLTTSEYKNWLEEQELFELEQIEKKNMEEHKKWMRAEEVSLAKWNKLQENMRRAHQLQIEKEAKIRQEWEEEQIKIKKAEERLKQIEEENKKQQQQFMEKLEQFLSGDTREPPQELLTLRETKPGMEACPFFYKTACCRFADQCSRNHQYPGIAKTLLATNFFTHFGLENSNYNEYDTDLMLEYEENDTYKDFKDFFYDVLPEFEKFGKVVQFKVCNNYEKHLRGNTYIEYAELRSAVSAYRALHSRWYGGRQISLQFCDINSWKNAICGLQSSRRCPKGRACNFMHVFKNPDNLFNTFSTPYENRVRTPRRSWRWSESPEVTDSRRRVRDLKSREEERSKEKRRSRHSEEDKRRSSRRSHSRDKGRSTRK
ncbi:U2 small nuclear ribonucleoprotein auxiliary factor 35 kDa subunit-related protein 2 [Plutella xylostella]|uniref:U2 small nuclear ribonucleoprotein auxiliary factor 35 kDa subunit-related protein 2 n=1 Tax=Plutella xylostella TaxID=51655 RepID=UPI0020324C96|nr:U2 small nuclear ribonucleoprotein auxiliary factor 35 kDa subunit-related protein 2 [Plutella xylostella]